MSGPARRPRVGRFALLGAAALALAGLAFPRPPDFTVVSGAVYGFLLGAAFGLLADRRDRP